MNKLILAYGVLSPRSRKRFFGVLILLTIGMSLEVLGIGLIMPVIDLLVNPDQSSQFPIWQYLKSFLGDGANVLLMGLAFVVGIFAVKNLFIAFQVYYLSKYSFDVQVETSTYLFGKYLSRPYEFFLKTNTSELLRNSIGEVNSFVGYFLQPFLIMVSEFLILLAVIGLLLYVEPLASFVAIAFVGGLGWVFHRFTRRRVAAWGKERQVREGMKIKCLQEGFAGIKAIKLLERDDFLKESFRKHTALGAEAGRKQYAIQQMPRLLLESLGVLGLALLTLGVVSGGGSEDSLPKLGMIAFGLVRIMPSVARMVHSCQSVIYGWPCVKVLREEIGEWESHPVNTLDEEECRFDEVFSLNKVSYSYSGVSTNSLTEVSIRVRKGSMVGIIGESGSGKSTLVDLALGLLEPSEGEILLDGGKIGSEISRSAWQNMIGYVPQEIHLMDETLRSNVALGIESEKIDDDRVWQCLEDASLGEFARGLPLALDTMMGERGTRLSGGQRQRVGIARALYHDPSFIVFDEATSSLDAETEESVMQTVCDLQKERTFLIVAHRMETLRNCEVIYRIKEGRVISSGNLEEMRDC